LQKGAFTPVLAIGGIDIRPHPDNKKAPDDAGAFEQLI